MISSLEVGSVFRLVDDASPTLQNITRELKLLNEQSERAKELLGSISQTAFKAAPSGALDDVIGNAKRDGGLLECLRFVEFSEDRRIAGRDLDRAFATDSVVGWCLHWHPYVGASSDHSFSTFAKDLTRRFSYFGVNPPDYALRVTGNSQCPQLLKEAKDSIVKCGQVPFQLDCSPGQNAIAIGDKLSL